MTHITILTLFFFVLILLLCAKPLGSYMAAVYEGKPCSLDRFLLPIERLLYRLCGIDTTQTMNWKQYLFAMLLFNLFGFFLVYAILRLQHYLPFNPQHFSNVSPLIAFNTAVSFVTNTNWQAYSGETTMSYFSQMTALTVQNFLSAATGMALLIALIRGIVRHEMQSVGNFWVDATRGILYILLPLSIIFAVFLVSQGVIQNLKPYQSISFLQPVTLKDMVKTEELIPMGPVASQEAIKDLGTNGGGFFNTNSAHPFENPTPKTDFLATLALLLIPAALCYTFGLMVNDKRQGWAILAAMFIIFIPLAYANIAAELQGNPILTQLHIDTSHTGGNLEGKEIRFGVIDSALWASVTTASSNGSSNAMLDSFTPLGGLIPLFLMHLSEVVFGGVGSGLYGMLMMIIMTVFLAGLMVGRTPEYLGKKINPFEMKMAAIAILIMPLIVLIFTAIAVVTHMGLSGINDKSAHGLTEILYAFTSMSNNNGSAFSGLDAAKPFYTFFGGIAMLIGRFWIAIPVLAIAGSLAKKKIVPTTSGTLLTYTPLFIFLLVSVIFIFAALSFLPALALGPIIEHLMLWSNHVVS